MGTKGWVGARVREREREREKEREREREEEETEVKRGGERWELRRGGRDEKRC